jgi:hypothetical protein
MCGGKSVWKQVYLVIVDRGCTKCGSVGRGHKDHDPYITSALLLSSHGPFLYVTQLPCVITLSKYFIKCQFVLQPAASACGPPVKMVVMCGYMSYHSHF